MQKNFFRYLITLLESRSSEERASFWSAKSRKWLAFSPILIGLTLALLYFWPLISLTPAYADLGDQFIFVGRERLHSGSIAWGDMDNDGDLDLAVGNSDTGQVNQLYRNDGGSEFSLVWQSNDAKRTKSVAWGDMDNDGDLDLAVGNSEDVNQLYRNEGGYRFDLVWESSDTKNTFSVNWGDMDNDGDLDLAVGNSGEVNQIYRNESEGNFTLAWESDDIKTSFSMVWGDMDNDGDLDLAVGNHQDVNQVYENNGDGNFNISWESLGDTSNTFSVAWGDMDADGDLDLAFGSSNWNQPNQIYRNNGDGSFTLHWESTDVSKSTYSVAWGDVDADGDLDLAVGNYWAPNSDGWQVNQIYHNNGQGDFTLGWESTDDRKKTISVVWGDVDGDGDLDLAIANEDELNQVYLNQGLAHLNNVTVMAGDIKDSHGMAWGDIDGDGDLDLAVGNDSQEVNQVYRNDGHGNLNLSWESTGDNKYTLSVAWGDMDGDGDLDLAVGNRFNEVNQVYENDGSGNFTLAWESIDHPGHTESIAWGDMDNDGDLDLAVGNSNQPNQIYQNEGGGNFVLAWESTDSKRTESIAWGDMDGDGDLDLAVGNYGLWSDSPEVNQVYRNHGGGNFTQESVSTGDNKFTKSVAWGDMDGDGDLDLAVGNLREVNQIFRNDGRGNFSLAWEPPPDQILDSNSLAWGDMDGDGDLDLAVGNSEYNQIYQNEGGGNFNIIRQSTDELPTYGIAWGDMDGDGDLDLAVGNDGGVNQIFENGSPRREGLPNDASFLTIARPDTTANANFYASSEIMTDATIPITYTLFDNENDPTPLIRAYYSANGGGEWFPATPAEGTETTNLAASVWPTGTVHVFNWDVAKDLIKSDHVVFRIEAYPDFTSPGPYLWPNASAQTFPFRVEAEWYAKVISETNQALEGALVYHDGRLITSDDQTPDRTDRAGLIGLDDPMPGQSLVALSQVQEQPTARQGHDGWAYRTYLTNITWGPNDDPEPFIIEGKGEQRLMVRRDSPLILFNIVVSVEWDADDAYLATIKEAFHKASDYLYDVTDGQMAFGEVNIYDNAQYWAHADFQISTKNTVRPYAFIGGITSDDTAHSIRVGRFWNGNEGNEGDWDQPNGYRTMIHEFGHYALYLYDEYFVRTVDENGNLTGQQGAACTGVEVISSNEMPTNASIMYYQYKASEFADLDRWTINCRNTEQARVNREDEAKKGHGETDWQTILRKYSDQEGDPDNPDWILNTPSSRGSVMAGPEEFPTHLLPFPTSHVHNHNSGSSKPARQLTVLDPDGQPFSNALVTLYTTPDSYTIAIDQGLTDPQGDVTIYGAEKEDIIRVTSFGGALAGAQAVDERLAYELTLSWTGPSRWGSRLTTSPYLELVPGSEGDTLSLKVHGVGAGSLPLTAVVIPGEGGGSPQSTSLAYSTSQSAYTGQVSFAGLGLGSGEAQVSGIAGGQLLSINSDYNLFQVINAQENELASEDGNMQWHIDAGSLPHNANAYAMIFPTGYVPKPLPNGKQLLGSAYGMRVSGATTELTKPGLLSMHYHPEVIGNATDLAIYRWNPATENWLLVGGEENEVDNSITAPVTHFGIYALGGSVDGGSINEIYLPIMLRNEN